MATINPTTVHKDPNVRVFQWTLANGDDGAPIEVLDYADISVEVDGTFGAAGSVQWEGRNRLPTGTFNVLNDAQGSPIVKTAVGLEQVVELARYQRPRVTAGDGTTALVVTAYCRRAR